jgi:hypothetical protein
MSLIDESASNLEIENRIEDIRKVMLDSLPVFLDECSGGRVAWDKVRSAANIQSLWYLRVDLMKVLSSHCGETVASDMLRVVTESFRGVLSPSQMPTSTRFQR